MDQQIVDIISNNVGINRKSVLAVVRLLDDSCTIPFIARYRKEQTGSLDEVEVLSIDKAKTSIEVLIKRKQSILSAITDQGKLTAELKSRIETCWDSTILEDLYLPYKKKKLSRAEKARKKGLEPLAKDIMAQRNLNVANVAKRYVNQEVRNVESAIEGAKDIIAEWISENDKTRAIVRSSFDKSAIITSKVVKSKEADAMKYRDYFAYSERLKKCPSHRILAIRRAEEEGLLRVKIEADKEWVMDRLSNFYVRSNSESSLLVQEALEDAYKRLLAPSIESEFKKASKEKADKEAIDVFADNLRQLLLDPPLGERYILALDPGFRTGCKWVVLDKYGELLEDGVIYPHPPQKSEEQSTKTLVTLTKRYTIEAVAIGNGTAGRESLQFLKGIKEYDEIEKYLVNESGASIYSASEIARKEFPELDLTVRGAISIGRRLMDPLAELVKIDPKSIGVGQYQHDVNQVQLKESLTHTVTTVVNSVGVNLNTASPSLLSYISGLGPKLAENIVNHRTESGPFTSRKELLKVPRMGTKAYEQAAGFLRIRDAKNVLDETSVHPERYKLVQQMAKDQHMKITELVQNEDALKQIEVNKYVDEEVGVPTIKDIIKELSKPGLDPRGEAKVVEFNASIKTIEDLTEGLVLNGVVTNLTNFGAFVDIGIKGDGLVHISQITDRFIKSPSDVLSLNQQIKVRIMGIDIKRSRVNLSMKGVS